MLLVGRLAFLKCKCDAYQRRDLPRIRVLLLVFTNRMTAYGQTVCARNFFVLSEGNAVSYYRFRARDIAFRSSFRDRLD